MLSFMRSLDEDSTITRNHGMLPLVILQVMKKEVKKAEIIITVAMLMPKLLPIASASAKFVVVERADAAPIVEDNFYNIKSQR